MGNHEDEIRSAKNAQAFKDARVKSYDIFAQTVQLAGAHVQRSQYEPDWMLHDERERLRGHQRNLVVVTTNKALSLSGNNPNWEPAVQTAEPGKLMERIDHASDVISETRREISNVRTMQELSAVLPKLKKCLELCVQVNRTHAPDERPLDVLQRSKVEGFEKFQIALRYELFHKLQELDGYKK